MILQTKVDIPKIPFTLDYSKRGLFVGSCFAWSLASRLIECKASVMLCPYGQMYNPLSILSFFEKCFSSYHFTEDDMVCGPDGLWYSWYHHGSIYARTPDELAKLIDSMAIDPCQMDYIVITLGTSSVFQLSDGRTVANCHKMPSSMFTRRWMGQTEISDCLEKIVAMFSPAVKFIVTVSPVRHLKDGLSENSFSKAQLRVAAEYLQRNHDNVYYFPSYEIMNDELRDYRFYEDDMLHPSPQAVSYIMENFIREAFDKQSQEFFSAVSQLQKASSHRPLHGDSPAYRKFVSEMKTRKSELMTKYPDVDFSDISFPDFL